MRLLDATSAEAYLRATGRIAPCDTVTVAELFGGVSNIVLLVTFDDPTRPPFVLKQAREQLRVAQPWFCSPERIWREVETLRQCESLCRASPAAGASTFPQVLFEDREHFLFAMEAAPSTAEPWKTGLLRGTLDGVTAERCGELLGRLHGRSWNDSDVAARLADRRFFFDLRVDPYYREVARRHPSLAPPIEALIDSLDHHRLALVHGDFSPKNLLVHDRGVMLIDYEVGHYGDPAFDLGFVLTHLAAKAFYRPSAAADYVGLAETFVGSYWRQLGEEGVPQSECQSLAQRTLDHWRACLLARIDGKSPVEYLDASSRERVRALALTWFHHPPATLAEAFAAVRSAADS